MVFKELRENKKQLQLQCFCKEKTLKNYYILFWRGVQLFMDFWFSWGVLEPNSCDKRGKYILTVLSQLTVNEGKVVAVCAIKAYREIRGTAVHIAYPSIGSR
jgi:hypothetical protein